jgi:hypothetical protein
MKMYDAAEPFFLSSGQDLGRLCGGSPFPGPVRAPELRVVDLHLGGQFPALLGRQGRQGRGAEVLKPPELREGLHPGPSPAERLERRPCFLPVPPVPLLLLLQLQLQLALLRPYTSDFDLNLT